MNAPIGGLQYTSPIAIGGSFPYNGGPQVSAVAANGGTVVLDEATPVTVANANVTANSIILFTLKTVGGTVVAGQGPNVMTITPGTGFTVAGASTDTSTYNYLIIG